MTTSREPLVVLQTNHRGREVVVGLAVEKEPISNIEPELPANLKLTEPVVRTVVGDCRYREFRDESETESTSGASCAWGDLVKRLRRSRRSTIQRNFSFFSRSFTIDSLVPLLSEDENPKIQREAARKLAEISMVEEHRSAIAYSSQAMAGLTRLLFVDKPSLQYYATVALGNLAAIEDNLQSLNQFPETVPGLVRLLFQYDEVLAQQGAVVALANLSLFPDGRRMILDTPQSIKGLVGLAVVTHRMGKCCGQEDAQRALLNLALAQENRSILDCPMSLPALAGILSPPHHEVDDRNTTCLSILEDGIRALASLAYTEQNAKKIAESSEFPRFLEVLVRFLVNSSSTTGSMVSVSASGYGLAARKLAATALANLSVTKDTQRMVAGFPDALTGLFRSLQVQDGERALSLQLQECAAMALGNLALVKENRRRIVDFGNSEGLECLAKVLLQDDNPGGQECAAWAFANLSHNPCNDAEEIAVKITDSPNIVRGLARLLQLPTSGSRSRITMQEQSVRALANLSFTYRNQVKLARFPNVVRGLAAALLCRNRHDNRNPTIQEYAALALANLTNAKEVWTSSEFFGNTLRALVDVLSPDNVEASQKARAYGAFALGNFLQASSHHSTIVNCKLAMGGLVTMLYKCDSSVLGKEEAAWALANLAQGSYFVKAAVASFPFALTSLLGSLSDRESLPVRAQALRALAGIGDDILNRYLSRTSVAETSSDLGFTHRQLFSTFEIPSRA